MPFDAFLKLDGVPGESTDARAKDQIEILSFSWGMSQSGAPAGGGGGAGKVQFQDFHFTMRHSSASILALDRLFGGNFLKFGTCVFMDQRLQGTPQTVFYKITMENVLVSSYQTSSSDGDEIPTETLSLNYGRVRVVYTYLQNGRLFNESFGWDLSQNKGI